MPAYRFGKHPPKIDYRTPRLAAYLSPTIPPPPPAENLLTRVCDNLKLTDPIKLFPMDANDRLGDCTIAALAHAETVYGGLIGKQRIMKEQAVVKLYMQLSGGVDSGLNELDVLNYWHQHPVSGDEIQSFVSVSPKNHLHVQQAIHLFGGVYLGFQVQENCLEEFNAHQPWTPGKLTTDGHAVYAVGYDATGVTVLTWGNTQVGTWDWWDECVDEAYAILPPEALKAGFCPGFDGPQLQADLAGVTN